MITYLSKRLAGLIPVFFGITLISFFVIHLAPGKPTDLQTNLNPKVSHEARLRLEKLYGLDKPVAIQYISWLGRFLRFDFGRSYIDDRPVRDKIVERIPVTAGINLISLFFILLIGIPIGIISAVNRGKPIDNWTTVGVFVGFSLPEFWFALLAISLFGVSLRWLPVSGITSLDFDYYSMPVKILDVARHLLLPVGIAVVGGIAGISRYTRQSMVSVLEQDYIRTARAKGLSEGAVIYKHALKNALLPVITIIGLSVPGLIGGSVIFESIFSIPGMGRLFYEAVMSRDYSTIMGILSIGAVLTLIGNLLADIAYAVVDPRIRVGKDL